MISRDDSLMPDGATIGAMRRWARERLRAVGIDTAALDADLLLAHAMGLTRERLLVTDPATAVPADARARYEALIAERAGRVPLAHLVGSREFFGRSFLVTPDVLVPRPETETLVEAVLRRLDDRPLRLLDLGTGSGAILLTLLAERPGWEGIGIDRSPAAAAVARRNAHRLGVASRARLIAGDWDAPLHPALAVDLVVSNPPYVPRGEIAGLMPEVRCHEPHLALDGGPDGLDGLRAVVAAAGRRLRPGGWLAAEIGADQGARAAALVLEAGLREVLVEADLAGRARVVVGRRPDPGRALMNS